MKIHHLLFVWTSPVTNLSMVMLALLLAAHSSTFQERRVVEWGGTLNSLYIYIYVCVCAYKLWAVIGVNVLR